MATALAALLLITGCGSGGGGDRRLVAALGDSITAGTPEGYRRLGELAFRPPDQS